MNHGAVRERSWGKGYGATHHYLRKYFPKMGICDECGESKDTDYALITGRTYSRDRSDYRELCRRCHVHYDGGGPGRWRGERGAEKRALAGDPPYCRCDCGQQVQWDRRHSRWSSYAPGHYVGQARLLRNVKR